MASQTIPPAIAERLMARHAAASSSVRWYPKVRSLEPRAPLSVGTRRCARWSREHLCPLVPEGALDGFGPACEPRGEQRQGNGGCIGEPVPGAGQQGQAAGKDPSHDLGDHAAAGQHQGDDQAAAAGFPELGGMVMVMTVSRVLQLTLTFPLYRVSRGHQMPTVHSARCPRWARIGRVSDTDPKHPLMGVYL